MEKEEKQEEEKMICAYCGEEIKETEDNFEDFFTLIRGRTPTAIYGYVCFDCWENGETAFKDKY